VADEPNEQGHMSHNDKIAQVGSIYRGLLPPPSGRRCFFPELPGRVRLERQKVVAKPPQTIEVKEEEKEGGGGVAAARKWVRVQGGLPGLDQCPPARREVRGRRRTDGGNEFWVGTRGGGSRHSQVVGKNRWAEEEAGGHSELLGEAGSGRQRSASAVGDG
jgi:hypothetical protein